MHVRQVLRLLVECVLTVSITRKAHIVKCAWRVSIKIQPDKLQILISVPHVIVSPMVPLMKENVMRGLMRRKGLLQDNVIARPM